MFSCGEWSPGMSDKPPFFISYRIEVRGFLFTEECRVIYELLNAEHRLNISIYWDAKDVNTSTHINIGTHTHRQTGGIHNN
jgi:hypothetical protein